jgi:Flp pilus assembly pilin Flp
MDTAVTVLNRLMLRRDEGQDLIEYALLVGLISIVAFVAVSTVGTTVNNLFWATFANVI